MANHFGKKWRRIITGTLTVSYSLGENNSVINAPIPADSKAKGHLVFCISIKTRWPTANEASSLDISAAACQLSGQRIMSEGCYAVNAYFRKHQIKSI